MSLQDLYEATHRELKAKIEEPHRAGFHAGWSALRGLFLAECRAMTLPAAVIARLERVSEAREA